MEISLSASAKTSQPRVTSNLTTSTQPQRQHKTIDISTHTHMCLLLSKLVERIVCASRPEIGYF
jgi:hypothetical protein